MGRPEAAVDFTVPERGELALKLRSLRTTAGLTYTQLVEKTDRVFSASHYKRAASGRELPSWNVVLAYAKGCIGPLPWNTVDDLYDLHRAAQQAVRKSEVDSRRSTVVPKPHLVKNTADLSKALRDVWARAGRPSMRTIARRSGVFVPHSTAHAIISGRTVPADLRQYLSFLEACDVTTPDELKIWLHAWIRSWGLPSDRDLARNRKWMDEETALIYSEVILAERAEQYDAQHVLHLLTRAIDRALDTIENIENRDKRRAMVTTGFTLASVAEVQQYLAKVTSITRDAIVHSDTTEGETI
ncbi:helix-turn-helix domain-containing protein [Streptomyces sp. NPDC057235]|uniref:helix-turn-helix domain-containing protein n=1 Tax=Streptomyces sp. NPDC057235 TaxID=3346058 RepID=UPI00362E58D2